MQIFMIIEIDLMFVLTKQKNDENKTCEFVTNDRWHELHDLK